MLFDLISGIFQGDKYAIISIMLYVIVVLLSLTVHECAHGYVAYRLGDPTARSRNRLSLNPKEHLDPVGTLMMLLFGWGWAKPVPVNPAYFKNRKLGMALTAFAGPVSNLLMSFFGLFIFRLIATFLAGSLNFAMSFVISEFFSYFCLMNIMLAIFNLLPVPPLDGSRVLNIILPERYYFKVMQYERYIYLVVILALVTDVLDAPLGYACSAVLRLFNNVLSLLPFLS